MKVNRTQRVIVIAVIALIVFSFACWCFYLANKYFDAGLWYLAVVSSDPNPPESAEVMRRYWMDKSSNWLWIGIGLLVLMTTWLVVNIKLLRRSTLKS